ncbi:AAA family ATPase [Pannonibacter sp. SL95]|uniref:AAA family ATPase n=1 Tax=Pannonibacter sp. SL95 TaxID=2995153 RepID=UPI00227253A8|nr:AAA family ATPase [Pannonibacter sp. SL95]MCY1705209.1 AAA family ATPase [Pannonibacter sp. SL95]
MIAGRTADDIENWRGLIERVREVAQARGWNKTEAGRRAEFTASAFSQWYSGSYMGRLDRQNEQIRRWLEAVENQQELVSAIPTGPGFLRLRTASEIINTLQWAQICPDLVVITAASGLGKTAACRYYQAVTPHVHMVTISPHTKTVHGMLVALVGALGVTQHNPARYVEAIGQRLEAQGGHTLLIVDEAQNLVDDAINQLRHFVDINRCGIALVGNEEIYARFTRRADGPSYAQLKRRIGKRLKRNKPYSEDLSAYIAAWGVTDPDAVRFLTGVGMKGGALGQIDKTMKLASMLSMSEGAEQVTATHIRDAWSNRDVEDMA